MRLMPMTDVFNAPSTKLRVLTLLRPFLQWELYLLGPFVLMFGQLRYLIIVVDYFTKWIEAKALAKIITVNVVKKFKNILSRFRVPQSIVTDNGPYFIDEKF